MRHGRHMPRESHSEVGDAATGDGVRCAALVLDGPRGRSCNG